MKNKYYLLFMLLNIAVAGHSQYRDLLIGYPDQPGYEKPFKLYKYVGKFKNRPMWTNSINHIAWYNNMWNEGMGTDTTRYFQFQPNYNSKSNSVTYPFDGWANLNLEWVGSVIRMNSNMLIESEDSAGIFTDSIQLTHNHFNSEGFAGNLNTDLVKSGLITINNLPNDFKVSITKKSDTILFLKVTGVTENHQRKIHDTSFIVVFNDNCFTNGGLADSTQNSKIVIGLNFRNVITVDPLLGEYHSIQKALDSIGNYDVIHVNPGTYTELNLSNSKSTSIFSIIGHSPLNTIIQADSFPDRAVSSVFKLNNVSNIKIKNLTIQNGYINKTFGNGAGILITGGKYNSVYLIQNCRINNNHIYLNKNQTGFGAGIYVNTPGKFKMINCEVSDNFNISTDSTDKNKYGGGLYLFAGYGSEIINSTISGNKATGNGGGLFCAKNVTFIHSTIVNNVSFTKGGGMINYDKAYLNNCIVWNNKAPSQNDIYQINSHFYKVYSINSFVKDTVSHISNHGYFLGSVFLNDPLIDTLKFNCSPTKTHALFSNSPAIDKGQDSSTFPELDQRDFKKVNKKDIGAFEFNIAPFEFHLDIDSVCIEDKKSIPLFASHKNGKFVGKFVENNNLNLSSLEDTGFVYVSYIVDYPGCENYEIRDSLLVVSCKINSVVNKILVASLSPNPVNNELFIKIPIIKNFDVTIYNCSGVKMFEILNSNSYSSIDVSQLTSGIYFATISTNDLKTTVKFIKN